MKSILNRRYTILLLLINILFFTGIMHGLSIPTLHARTSDKSDLTGNQTPEEPVKYELETGLNLQLLIDKAISNNPEIVAAQNRWEAAKNQIKMVKSLDDPSLRIGVINSPDHPFNFGKDASKSAPIMSPQTISITQKIPFPGKLKLKGQAASENAEMEKNLIESKIQEIIAEVKHHYYELYFIDKSIEINLENKELLRKFTKIAEAMYAVGKSSQRDVLAAMVEHSKIENKIIVLEQSKQSTLAKLNNILNRNPDAPLGKPKDFNKHKLTYKTEELETLALNSRPLVLKTDHAVKKNQFNLQLAKKNYFSDFTAMIEYRHLGDSTSDTWSSALSINIPWLWSKQRYKVKEAGNELKASMADRETVNNQTQYEIRDLISRVVSTESTVDLFKTNIIPKAEQALNATRIEYETGKVDFLTLIDSQRTLLDSKLQYYKSLVEYEQNIARLEKTVGVELTMNSN